jgi:hypothetical protein
MKHMESTPFVKDGFILIPVAAAPAIAKNLRLLEEVIGTVSGTEDPAKYQAQWLAYCFEQARPMPDPAPPPADRPGILTMTTETTEPRTWFEGWTYRGKVTSARVEDGELRIEAKSGPIIMKIALPASTTFEPTKKTFPDGTALTESVPLYRQQMGRAHRPGAKPPTTFVCDTSVLTAGMVDNPTSLPEAAKAYIAALDAEERIPTVEQIVATVAALDNLRTAVAQVIP